MLKKLYFLAALLPFIGLSTQAQNISVSLFMPDQATAGKKILVRVIINKGSHSDFARFKQKIPAGFKVEPVQTANSDFSYKDGEANFIWLKLPPEKKITLVYSLMPDIRLQGVFHFTGLFSYIKDSEREEVSLPEKTIKILPSARAAVSSEPRVSKDAVAKQRSASGEQQERTPPGMAGGKTRPYALALYRQTPFKASDGRGWIVHILVSRGNVDKLGRIEEKIPAGYRAENVDGKGAIFSFRGGVVKFIWMKFPPEPLFVVSYLLVPGDNAPIGVPPKVTGVFSYMLKDNPAIVLIKPVQETIPSRPSEEELSLLMAKLGKTAPSVMQSENKPEQPAKNIQQGASEGRGIYFRVQILATKQPVNIEKYLKRDHLPGKIYTETEKGLYKYTTGFYTSYREARVFINHLGTDTGIQRAFVTAYDKGKRIPVKEALNRTGQKWFR